MEMSRKLSNGLVMPRLGLGVWRAKNEDAEKATEWALRAGYRLLDTAAIYKNEEGVGAGIRSSGVPRDDIFLTTKLWNADQGYDSALKAFDESLEKLGTDYVDLYLIHWPVAGKYKDSWRAMEEIYASGRAKAIGLSNFHKHHVEDLMQEAKVKPVLDQIEIHPTMTQEPLREYLASMDIAVEAWSPLGQGKNLVHPVLEAIGKAHHKTAAQAVIRWHLQHDIIAIPKSVHKARIEENFDVMDFELTSEEMKQIDALNIDERIGADPDNFDF